MRYLFKKGDTVLLVRYQNVMTCIVRGRHNDGSMTVEDLFPKPLAPNRFRVPQRELCALPPPEAVRRAAIRTLPARGVAA